ncbi:hypothetical protein NEDG_02073 [Nematocida displodere]|uniref:Uncharacterized protein n=1 Tax=Nematocida displodere TaxID=1805483 RepID=A0A177EJJ2_9MICR|nr:hypothetical protein NEDG_02073 [Nematocida displodere]
MVEGSGVHAYLTGKFMSRTILIMIAVITAICYIDILVISICYHVHVRTCTSLENGVVIVTILTQVSLTTTVNLLLMQGFINRNILQIILVSFFNGTTKLVLAWRCADEMGDIIGTLTLVVGCIFIGFLFCTTIFGLLCRKEFGWFYYKTYGANIKRNSVYTIRAALDDMFKVVVQLFVCMWVSKYFVQRTLVLFIPVTVIEYIGILIYIAEYRIESYLLRCTNIILNSLVLTFHILQVAKPLFIKDSELSPPDGTTFNNTYTLLDTCNRVLIEGVYIILLTLDTFSFGYGYTGPDRDMRRKRMLVNTE